MRGLTFYPLEGMPEVEAGCDLAGLLWDALGPFLPLRPGDVLVVTHKIVSKAAGLVTGLEEVTPSPAAREAAALCRKDPRLVELMLRCSEKVYACERDILIAVRRDGWVCCNAGLDHSNAGGRDRVVILPEDCDRRARELSGALSGRAGLDLPVLICDTQGRVLRSGASGVVVGSFGVPAVRTYAGQTDRGGRELVSTREAVADELAGAATLVMGQGDEGIPAVLVRGCELPFAAEDSAALRRPESMQLYRAQGAAFLPEKESTP